MGMKNVRKGREGKGDIPAFTQVRRIPDSINALFIIHHDQYTPLITKLVFMRVHPDHFPRNACVCAQKRITIFVGLEVLPDRPYAHDEPWCRGRENPTKVMRRRDGMEMERAFIDICGVARDPLTFTVRRRRTYRSPRASYTPTSKYPKPDETKRPRHSPSSKVITVLKCFNAPLPSTSSAFATTLASPTPSTPYKFS